MSRLKRAGKKHRPPLRRLDTLGAPPGSIIVDPAAPDSIVHVTHYDAASISERKITDVAEIKQDLSRGGVTWINVEGLGSAATIKQLATLFHLHPLAMEDAVNVHQRPKVDRYGEQLFIALRMDAHSAGMRTEQVSMFVGRGFVITFWKIPATVSIRSGGDCVNATA